MANLVPRAFPLKVGRAGKSPGNEVEKWPEIKETKRESRIPILTYRKASATTVWSANSFATVFHLLCKKAVTISELNILGFYVRSSFSKIKKISILLKF